MKKTKKSPKKNPKFAKIELAPCNIVDDFGEEIIIILKALGHPESLVTDESYISDFLPFLGSMDRQKAFESFKKKMNVLGIDVEFGDSLINVAKRIRVK